MHSSYHDMIEVLHVCLSTSIVLYAWYKLRSTAETSAAQLCSCTTVRPLAQVNQRIYSCTALSSIMLDNLMSCCRDVNRSTYTSTAHSLPGESVKCPPSKKTASSRRSMRICMGVHLRAMRRRAPQSAVPLVCIMHACSVHHLV